MNLKKITSNRLLELRCGQGLNQAAIAELLTADVSSVSAWENNKYQPSPRYAGLIKTYFGLPYEEIFTFST